MNHPEFYERLCVGVYKKRGHSVACAAERPWQGLDCAKVAEGWLFCSALFFCNFSFGQAKEKLVQA